MNSQNIDSTTPVGDDACSVTTNWIHRDVVVVAILGDLDMATAPEVADAIRSAVEHGPGALIVDLSRVHFLASAGINLLISVHRDLLPSKQFGVVADGPATSRPLTVIGVDTILAVYRTLDEALNHIA